MDKVKWEKCSGCKRPTVCSSNLIKLRALLGVGVVGVGVLAFAALPLFGFGTGGIVAGSFAASWQSSIGVVTAGSLFAILQSLGATGLGSLLFGGIGTALGLLGTLAVKLNWCDDMKANLRIMSIKNDCSNGGKSTYRLRIDHIKYLTTHLSQEFEQGDIKWKVGANVYSSTQADFFGIDLVGNKPSEMRVVVRIFSGEKRVKNTVQRVLGPQSDVDGKHQLKQVIRMKELLKSKNEFIVDESIIVDVEITDGKYLPTLGTPELQKLFSEKPEANPSFGKNQTELKIKNIKKACRDGCITTLQLVATNIKNLMSDRRVNFKQKGISWEIVIFKRNGYVGLEFIPAKSCKTRILAQLHPWNKDLWPIEAMIAYEFDKKRVNSSKISFNKLILWDELIHNSLIVEIQLIDGIYLDNPSDEGFLETNCETRTEADAIRTTETDAMLDTSPVKVTCKICSIEYDRQENSCGHTFCSECIRTIIQRNNLCAECKNPTNL